MANQFVRYIVARSELTASPTRLGTTQTAQMTLRALDRTRRPRSVRNISLGGQTQTIYHRGEVLWNVQHTPVTGTPHLQMREFLDSVEAGETFELDPGDGSGFRDVIIESKSYTERRVVKTGGGPVGDFYEFRWQCRELP